jgi:hypothetical protein
MYGPAPAGGLLPPGCNDTLNWRLEGRQANPALRLLSKRSRR